MAHITSARIRKAESLCRRQASKLRREHGLMARAQVKKAPDIDAAMTLKETLTKELLTALAESYPKDGFTHEGKELKASQEGGLMWHINGLGGFENFVRGREDFYQLFVITKDGKPVEAFGYLPLADQLSLAVHNNGATGYESRLRVSGRKNLKGGIVNLAPECAAKAAALMEAEADVRVSGSLLTDILDVCAGRVEGFASHEMPLAEGLFAALMVTESGGKTTEPGGDNGIFIAANLDCYNLVKKHVG